MNILVLTLVSVAFLLTIVNLTSACTAVHNGCSKDADCCGDMNCVKGVCKTCGQSGDSCLLDMECCNYDSSRANQVRYVCSLASTSCVAAGVVTAQSPTTASPITASTTQQTVVANANPGSCAGSYFCPPGFYCVKNQQNGYSCKTIQQVLDEKLLDYQNGTTLTTKGNGTLLVMKIYELSPNLKDHNASDMATIKQKTFTEKKDGINVHESSLSINSNIQSGNLTELKAAEQPLAKFFQMLQPSLVIPNVNPNPKEKKTGGSLIDQLFSDVNKEMNGEGNPFKEIEQTLDSLNKLFEHGTDPKAPQTSNSGDPIAIINKLYGGKNSQNSNSLNNALMTEDNQINHVKAQKTPKEILQSHKLMDLMKQELEQDQSSIAHLKALLEQEATSTTTTTTPATTTTTHKSLWQSILALL